MMDGSTTDTSRPIVLIHGLFLNWQSWDGWVQRYRARGFTVFAPDGRAWMARWRNCAPIPRRSRS